MKRVLLTLSAVAIAGVIWAQSPQSQTMKIVDKTLEFCVEQSQVLYSMIESDENQFPRTVANGELVTNPRDWWTSGFFPGTMWYIYEYCRDEKVLAMAEHMTHRVLPEQFTTNNHDVGFMINCSAGNGYRLTHKEEYRQALINAGTSLATRFSDVVGCTRSWDHGSWDFNVIIDNMMNTELLCVSSALTGDNTHYDMAKRHSDVTMQNHFRADGSCYHVVEYSSKTGEFIKGQTHQGYADDSAWARGQAWALYGYTMMYRESGKKEYLDQAILIGNFIADHPRLPSDKIPYWDFDAPNIPRASRDASAGAIMASAYIELSQYVDSALAEKFLRLGEKQVVSLSSKRYRSAKVGDNCGFILTNCVGHMPNNYEIDAPLSYADYYFVEALMRLKRLEVARPVVELYTAYSENPSRAVWLSAMDRISRPLLGSMSEGRLREKMPVETRSTNKEGAISSTHLEALGRLICGIAPWLELGEGDLSTPEMRLRAEYIDLAVRSITNGVDPQSPDYLNFNNGHQSLVDAAFLAHGLLRAKQNLWGRLDAVTQQNLIEELKSSRAIKPSENNWLLFSAMVELAIKEFGGEWNFEVVQYALDKHHEWYKGDGWYGDGPNFHLDYYNSYVIQPMLVEIVEYLDEHDIDYGDILAPSKVQARYQRYGSQQERLISPEGTFPVVGRSLGYRFGAFQALSDVAYRHLLAKEITPAQVREGLTAVISRQVNVPGTFDADGWLTLGFAGHQPLITEVYISTGSLYLCAAAFIALGLDESDEFWSGEPRAWTSKRVWEGEDIDVDKALYE